MKINCLQNLKFLRLVRKLKLSKWQAIGILEGLWTFAVLNAQDGGIGRFSNEEIAAWLEWEGDADALINALVNAGFLDASDEFRLIVHDWFDHCPNYLKGVVARRKKPRPAQGRTSGGKFSASTVASTALSTEPSAVLSTAPSAVPEPSQHGTTKSSQVNPSQNNPSPPPTPSTPNARPESIGGGGGSVGILGKNPAWWPVIQALKELGVTTAEAAVYGCVTTGGTVEWANAVIAHFRSKPGAWNPQFLAWRLRESDKTMAPSDGWPSPTEAYQQQNTNKTKQLEARKQAEDGAVYTAIKNGRAAGTPDEAIRDDLIARGLTAALIRFGWLDSNGQMPMPAAPPVPAKKPPVAAPAAGPPTAATGENPF